jgi:hypothetical protein
VSSQPPAIPRRDPRLRRNAVLSLLLAVGIAGFVFAFTLPGPDKKTSTPSAVESVSPAGGDLDLRQGTIMADLAPGYTGYLEIDGIEVPADDLQHVDALNQVILRPTPDSAYQQIPPGPHCAAVVYHQIGNPGTTNRYQWCFTLH